MNWSELLSAIGFRDVTVTIINPVRKDEQYKSGKLVGFKPGLYGGGHSNFKHGVPHSYSSDKQHWIKTPKVLVAYNCFTWGKSQHTDWIDVDNCTFEFAEPKSTIEVD